MNGMAATLDGRVAVGCNPGGLHLYTPDGERETKLSNARIARVDYLSNGKCVVRDPRNNISMYTSDYEQIDVRFPALNWNECGDGGMTVDYEDNIYISYSKLDNIQVFSPSGGKPVKELPCNGCKPWQMFALKTKKMMVVHQKAGRDSIGIQDETGSIKITRVPDSGFDTYGYPAVCQNGNILIAWIEYKKGVVTIKEYSPELELIKTLISNFEIQIPFPGIRITCKSSIREKWRFALRIDSISFTRRKTWKRIQGSGQNLLVKVWGAPKVYINKTKSSVHVWLYCFHSKQR